MTASGAIGCDAAAGIQLGRTGRRPRVEEGTVHAICPNTHVRRCWQVAEDVDTHGPMDMKRRQVTGCKNSRHRLPLLPYPLFRPPSQ